MIKLSVPYLSVVTVQGRATPLRPIKSQAQTVGSVGFSLAGMKAGKCIGFLYKKLMTH